MKNSNIIISLLVLLTASFFFAGCEDEKVKPTLAADSDSYTRPALENPETMDLVELLPENAGNKFETFAWSKADYGVQVPVNYVVEADSSDAFSAPVELAKTAGTSVDLTVKNINDAALALGLPAFSESAIKIRTTAVVNGGKVDSIHSDPITRMITTYQVSECGNFCTIGLIGSATAGGWDSDIDMRLVDATRVDKYTWTLTVFLNTGAVKFRADDDWATNWGASGFPEGTGEQNGPDIPINTAGYYKIIFNDNTGDYTFTLLAAPEFATIGLIGTATAGGWDSDTDMTQDPSNPHIWTATLTLAEGLAKFRAGDAWDNNWGGESFPSGYGTTGGADIAVPAGEYFIWFNDATGEYAFMRANSQTPFSSVGILGTVAPGQWDADTDLIKNPSNPYRWSAIISLAEGVAKFRADNAWDVNWGGAAFPSGTSVQDGPNIPVPGGKYMIHFHAGTGEYYFLN